MADHDVYLHKAIESLASAQSDFDNGRYNSAANRSYFACLHAAVAALTREGLRFRSGDGRIRHEALQSQFVSQLIRRRRYYSFDLRSVLARNQELRQVADYETIMVSQQQAARALRRTKTFVNAIIARGGQPG